MNGGLRRLPLELAGVFGINQGAVWRAGADQAILVRMVNQFT